MASDAGAPAAVASRLPDMAQEDASLREAIKRLFRGIRDGRVVLTEHVPETAAALKAVQFTEDGEPVMDTVTGPVRALAYSVTGVEAQKAAEGTGLPLLLPERVDVSEEVLAKARREGRHLGLAFALYKEAATLITLCSGAFIGVHPESVKLSRERAIPAALLARIAKFMSGVLHLAQTGNFGEVVMALNRPMLESAVDVMYLCQTDDQERYRRFVVDGLSTERDLVDRVNANIAKRGHKLPIEDRLLAGAARIFRASGMAIEDVDPKARPLDLASRLRALGREDDYLFIQRLPSAAVHGTWLDLLHHHIRELEGGGFAVRFMQTPMSVRLLAPIAVIMLEAAEVFVEHFLSEAPESADLCAVLSDTHDRFLRLDASHERWLQVTRGQKAQDDDQP